MCPVPTSHHFGRYVNCQRPAVKCAALKMCSEFVIYHGHLLYFIFCSYRYSGEIYGIGNMFATIPGIVAPLLVNMLTPNVSTSISSLLIISMT